MPTQRSHRAIHVITTYLLIFSLLSSPVSSRRVVIAAPAEGERAGTALQAAAAQVTLTKSDSVLLDQDGDGEVEAGDRLRYELTAAATGSVDAAGVTLNDVLDANLSLVPGSLHTTPLAFSETVLVPEDTASAPITLHGADFDGDTLTYKIVSSPSSAALQGTLPNLTYGPLPPNVSGLDSVTFRVCDSSTPSNCDEADISIHIVPVNDAPSFSASSATVSVEEDSGAYAQPGWASAISKGPADESGQTLNFVVSNDKDSLFSAQPSVSSDGTLSFTPAPDQYGQAEVSVTLHDDGGTDYAGMDASAALTFTVVVEPVNDAPAFTAGPDQSVQEDAGKQTVADWAADITPGPNEASQTVSFEITHNTNPGLFSEVPSVATDGTLTYTPAENLQGAAEITLRLTDNGGTANGGVDTSLPQTFMITVADVNDSPLVNPATFTLAENSILGALVGQVTYTDVESGQAHTFSISAGDDSGVFTIDPTSGVISVAKPAALDFESAPTFSLTVMVTDDGSPAKSGTGTVTIHLSDVDEAPVVSPAAFSLPENSLAGALVGTVTAIDPENAHALTFAITAGNTGGAFGIDSLGQITVLNASAVDFETNPVFNLTVAASESGGLAQSGSGAVTVTLSNVNEAALVNSATFTVDEGSPNGTLLGTVTISDPEALQTHTFAITGGDPDGAFAIDSSGNITVANSSMIKFTTSPSYSLTVAATDNGTPAKTGTGTITVTVTNINDTPVVTGADFSVDEDKPTGTVLGTITYTDPDSDQTHTFSILSGNTGDAFTINGTTGQITTASALDFETHPTYTLVVAVTDNGDASAQGKANVVVTVNDINEAPVVSTTTLSVPENSLVDASVGVISISDPETGQTHTFAITSGNEDGVFAIHASTGEVSVAKSGALNYETKASYSLQIQVTDSGSPAAVTTAAVTINLTDVNEAPVIDDTTFSINENRANGSEVGTLSLSDPETDQTHTFSILSGNTGDAFAIDSTGKITVATTAKLDFEVTPVFNLVVKTTDSGSPALSDTAAVTVQLLNVNEAPVVVPDSYQTIGNTLLEVAQAGTASGAHISVTGTLLNNDSDPDAGDEIRAALKTATAGAVVTISPTGEFTYLPPAVMTSDSFTYSVTDKDGLATTGTVTITMVGRVWYVQNNAAGGGLGRSVDPFDTLAEAETASMAGETIYIFKGSGTTTGQNTGITLKNNQRLIGAGVALEVPVSVNSGSNPTPLLPADEKPSIGNSAGNAVSITGGSAEVSGLNIAASGNGFNMVVDRGSAQLNFSSNNVTSGAKGVWVNGTGSTLTVTGFADNQFSGDISGDAVTINSATFDAVPGGAINQLELGSFSAGISGNPVGGSGLVITNAFGNLHFTALNIYASGANGLQITRSFSTYPLEVSIDDGQGSVTANAGKAVSLTNLQINAPNLTLVSTGSAIGGAEFVTVTGLFSTTSASAITGSRQYGLLVNGGSLNLTHRGPITNTSGRTVEVHHMTDGSATFSGAINGVDTGVSLHDNLASVNVSFTGGLIVNTTVNDAFTATGPGTLVITGANNTLTSTTGKALNVQNTTIGASGLSFKKINANGAAVGIELLQTGNQGGLTITGDGSAGSGGLIQNTTGDGVRLTGVMNVSLNNMTISNTGNSNDEYGLMLKNLAGIVLLQNSTIIGMYETGIWLNQDRPEALNLTLNNLTVSSNSVTAGEDGFQFLLASSAAAKIQVKGSTFKNLQRDGIDGVYQDNAKLNLTVDGNTFQNSAGRGGVILSGYNTDPAKTAKANLTLTNNQISNTKSTAIVLTSAGIAQLDAVVTGNSIVQPAQNGPLTGEGIRLSQEENSTMKVQMDNNQISGAYAGDIIGLASLPSTSGSLNITARNNTASMPVVPESFGMDFEIMDQGHTFCLDLTNNQAIGNDTTGFGAGIFLANDNPLPGIFQLAGASGTLNHAQAEAFIDPRNPGSNPYPMVYGEDYIGVTSCLQAVGAALPATAMSQAAQFAQAGGRGAGLASLRNPYARAAGTIEPVNIGVLPAGKTVKITYDVIVADPLPKDVNQVSNQAVLRGSNFTDVLSDDPSTSDVTGDPTITRLYHSPAAVDDVYTVPEDMVLEVLTPGVLKNDHASPGFTLSAVGDSLPAVGTLDLKPYGAFTYITAPDANGDVTFTYHANDGSNDTNPAQVTLHVLPVNDAPVLDPSGSMHLNPVNGFGAVNTGTLVSELLASAGDRIRDVDARALEGIAITAADTSHGDWQYRTNSGLTWKDMGQPSESEARLLASDAGTRLRFIPYPGFSGAIGKAVTFRAWDRTAGINGGTANVSASGGKSPYSAAVETASIAASPQADLGLSMSVSEQNPLAGSQVVFSLKVTNNGPSAAQGVKITDSLTKGFRLVKMGNGCSESAGLVTCALASLNPGESASFELTVKIDLDYTGSLENTASVTSQTQDLTQDNDSASVTVMVAKQAQVVDPDQPPDPKEWNRPVITQPECGSSFMGEYSNETVSLNLKDLPQHSQVIVEFDLIIIRSWDGNQIDYNALPAAERQRMAPLGPMVIGPDVWRFGMDGKNLLTTTFSNWDQYVSDQAYPGSFPGGSYPARTGAMLTNTLCYSFEEQSLDSVYHMRYIIPHTAGDLQLDFAASGLQRIEDESWGLDNISVRLTSGADLTPYRYYIPGIGK